MLTAFASSPFSVSCVNVCDAATNSETKEGSALGSARAEELNGRAVDIIQRIQTKLTGRDFGESTVLGTDEQVDKLIQQATSVENLCQLFIGWCPYW